MDAAQAPALTGVARQTSSRSASSTGVATARRYRDTGSSMIDPRISHECLQRNRPSRLEYRQEPLGLAQR